MSLIEGLLSGYTVSGTPTNGTDEVQTLTVSGTPTGGTFRLRFDNFVTDAIAYDAASATVQTALRALPSIGSAGVSVSGSPGGAWTVTFAGNLTKLAVSLLVLHANDLTGGTDPSVGIVETTPGVTATARGAAVGATLTDTTNGLVYSNQGTALAPVWLLQTPEPTATVDTNGAITAKLGTVFIIKTSAGAYTIADPTATSDDGKLLVIQSTTAFAHTVSNAAGSGFNAGGAGAAVATFGGAKGDQLTLKAYQGDWYVDDAVNVSIGA